MSRTKPTATERAEVAYRCTECGARPGDWCVAWVARTGLGAWARGLHANRRNAAQEATAADALALGDQP